MVQTTAPTNHAFLNSVTFGGCDPTDTCMVNIGLPSQYPPYELDNGVGYAAGLFFTPEAQALAVQGDGACSTSAVNPAFSIDIRPCPSELPPPVWLRFYDGPNQVSKANYEEISFEYPAPANGLPIIVDNQSLFEQLSILQPFPVFDDLDLLGNPATYCDFSNYRTVWNNGGFNFEITAGNLKMPTGDAPPIEPYNTLLPEDYYSGWTTFSLMALGNGAGGAQAGFQLRPDQSTDPQPIRVKYTLDNEHETMLLELRYKQNTTKYMIPQEMFKKKFLPVVLESGYLPPLDKQVKEIEDFVWVWSLFTMITTVQKPKNPAGNFIALDDVPKYFPLKSTYNDIRVKVKGYSGYNNVNAFDQNLTCLAGFELYGSLFDNLAFFGVEGSNATYDLKNWLDNLAPKCDPRYAYWNCVYGIAHSRQTVCLQKQYLQGVPWTVAVGFLDGLYPQQCNSTNPDTASIISGQKFNCPNYQSCPTKDCT